MKNIDLKEFIEAMDALEEEKGISKEVLMEAIEKSVYSACEKDFGKDIITSMLRDKQRLFAYEFEASTTGMTGII